MLKQLGSLQQWDGHWSITHHYFPFSEFRSDAHKFRSRFVTPFSLSRLSWKSVSTPYLAASTWAPFHLLASLEQAPYKTYISVSDPPALTSLFVDVTPLLHLCTVE